MTLIPAYVYGQVTGDTDNVGTIGSSGVLADAEVAVEEHCRRKLGYGTWKETLYVYKDGKVYPSATPIVAVTVPAGQTMIEGNGVWIGWQNNYPLIAGYGYGGGSFPPRATIVYTGGYQPAGTTGGVTPAVPMKVRDAICWVAYRMLHPIVLPGVPYGVTSVHTGDVGYTASKPLSTVASVDTDIAALLSGWRRRNVHAWGAPTVAGP